ncbi:hypothetical protein [Saccharothrix sp. ST-888]|uniref:hypothetical protein n=1 Tax=Saccharothrix sp. ST-888 TaxID=1427391 RepID=UPI000A98DF10|nr:hypothetical protein [Saccharothrix sp. ST-888]
MPGSIRLPAPVRPVSAAALGALGVLAVLVTVGGCGSAPRLSATARSTGASASVAGAPTSVTAESTAGPTATERLSAAQLPNGAVEGWHPLAPPRTQAVTGAVQLDECASVPGAASWQQQAYVSVYRTPAEQDLFTFRDGTAAQTAYQGLLTQMDACQTVSRALQAKALGTTDAQVTRTAVTDQGTAWSRQWTGVEGLSAAGPQTDHLYAVQQGTTLAVVHFDEWAATHAVPYSTRADGDLLTSVARQLG